MAQIWSASLGEFVDYNGEDTVTVHHQENSRSKRILLNGVSTTPTMHQGTLDEAARSRRALKKKNYDARKKNQAAVVSSAPKKK